MKNLFIIAEDEKNRIINLHESATKNQYLINEANGQTKEEYPECIKQMGNPVSSQSGQWSIKGINTVKGYQFYANKRVRKPDGNMTNYSCSGNKIIIDGKTYNVSGSKSFSYYIKQAQTLLGVPATGVVDDKTLEAAKTKLNPTTPTK